MDKQEDILRRLGRRITELREERQLPIAELARRTALDPDDLTAMEAGKKDIPLTVIYRLTQQLGTTFDEFLNFL